MTDAHTLQRAALAELHPTVPEPPAPSEDGWPVLSDDAYHGLAGDIVHTLEPHTEADPVALLASLLTAYGAVLGPNHGVIADAAHHPARLFACLVGRTGKARKGTSWRNVRRLIEIADGDFVHKRVKSGLSSGEGLVAAVADPEESPDGEPVPETGTKDKRLLDLEEEFARVLQVARRESSTLSAIVRQAYDTGDLSVLTKTPLVATGAHIAILGHITVEELRAKLTSTDIANGFANRFLYLLVRRSKLLPDGHPPSPNDINRLGGLLSHKMQAVRTGPKSMERSPGAERLWKRLYEAMAADEPPGVLGALTARPEAHTLRLSVTYALLDGSHTIGVEHLKAGWALWLYSRASCEAIWEQVDGSAAVKKLYRAIADTGDRGLSLTDQSEVFNRHMPAKDLEAMRLDLESQGRIVTLSLPQNGSGRPSKVSYAVGSGAK